MIFNHVDIDLPTLTREVPLRRRYYDIPGGEEEIRSHSVSFHRSERSLKKNFFFFRVVVTESKNQDPCGTDFTEYLKTKIFPPQITDRCPMK